MRKGAQTSVLFSDAWEWLRGAVRKGAEKCPAILLVFDMLESAGTDLIQLPLSERRHRLEDVLSDLHPCLQLIL